MCKKSRIIKPATYYNEWLNQPSVGVLRACVLEERGRGSCGGLEGGVVPGLAAAFFETAAAAVANGRAPARGRRSSMVENIEDE